MRLLHGSRGGGAFDQRSTALAKQFQYVKAIRALGHGHFAWFKAGGRIDEKLRQAFLAAPTEIAALQAVTRIGIGCRNLPKIGA